MSGSLLTLLVLCSGALVSSSESGKMTVSPECAAATQSYREAVRSLSLSRSDRDAIARVTIAEAGDQGDVGMAAVVHTVVNRLIDGRFGDSAQKIVDAPHQFEPVHRA